MGEPPGDPGGQKEGGGPNSQLKPGQTFAGAAKVASGTVPGGRTWQQIFNDAKEKRNILEIHISPINTGEALQQKPKPLTNDQLSEIIFKILKIKVSDHIALDYSGWFGHKEM